MNEQNFEYLKDNIKYMGFGEKLNADLDNALKSGATEFQLSQSMEINRKSFDVTLNFRRSDQSDMYFFNSYHAALKHSNGEVKDQVFYLTKGKGVTAKEAYNLLDGRAVMKELTNKIGEPYKAWLQLDFDKKDKHNNHEVKQYHEAYGYDLKAALSKFAVSEMDGGDREKSLLQSLQKGNVQTVGIANDVGVSKMFVEANPQYKTVTFYDSEMKRVPKESLEQYLKPGKEQAREVKQERGQEVVQQRKQKLTEGGDGVKPSKNRSKSRSASM
ncbi:MAG TPA: hypothetical protein VMR70_01160 [Flavisolibacter sp.]|nr:hypothetical protein [Flavisolibacter sp.]